MKMPTLIRRKKLRATARRSLAMPEMDYEEMSEPNMKLSRALLIVLVLHVVAVAGIIAFNTIKTRQGSFSPAASTKTAETKTVEAASPGHAPANAVEKESTPARRDEVKTSRPNVAKEEAKIAHAKQGTSSSVADSGKVYVVAKGDNPVTIARKLKVPYDSLIELNHIDDPRKLQIGQKLLIPKITKPRKPTE